MEIILSIVLLFGISYAAQIVVAIAMLNNELIRNKKEFCQELIPWAWHIPRFLKKTLANIKKLK